MPEDLDMLLLCRLATTIVEANFVDAIGIEQDEVVCTSWFGIDTRFARWVSKLHPEPECLELNTLEIFPGPFLRWKDISLHR
jgi:hypothetical protein